MRNKNRSQRAASTFVTKELEREKKIITTEYEKKNLFLKGKV